MNEVFTSWLTTYGPLALGWLVAAYLLKFVLDRYQADIEARVSLATSMDGLAKIIATLVNRGTNGKV